MKQWLPLKGLELGQELFAWKCDGKGLGACLLKFESKVTPHMLGKGEENTICSKQFIIESTVDLISVI